MKFDKFHLMFNGAGALILLTVVVYIARTAFVTNAVDVCEARYLSTMTFEYSNQDGALTPIDLQSRATGREWGLLTNAAARELTSGPAKYALEVTLAKDLGTIALDQQTKSGITFDWAPGEIGRPLAACLKYSVWVGDDFDFGQAGKLPGIYGTVTGGTADDPESAFAAPVIWRTEGTMYVAPRLATDPKSKVVFDFLRAMPRGEWVEVAQEIILNAPGASDGRTRVFVNGKLKLDVGGIPWRKDGETTITGVRTEVSFDLNTPKDQTLILSPMELRW